MRLDQLMPGASAGAGNIDVADLAYDDRRVVPGALMRHRAVCDGVRLLERDRDARVRLEARGLLDYLDTAPLRATLAAGVQRRIDEGRFGRR